jgi:hypothetical protein
MAPSFFAPIRIMHICRFLHPIIKIKSSNVVHNFAVCQTASPTEFRGGNNARKNRNYICFRKLQIKKSFEPSLHPRMRTTFFTSSGGQPVTFGFKFRQHRSPIKMRNIPQSTLQWGCSTRYIAPCRSHKGIESSTRWSGLYFEIYWINLTVFIARGERSDISKKYYLRRYLFARQT